MRLRCRWAVAMGSLLLASCATEADALCDEFDRVVEAQAGAPRPDPLEIAERYRELATGHERVARALDGDDAAESTFELADLYRRGADILDEHAGADRQRLDELFAESAVLVSLDERMSAGVALGFTRPAWNEISARCDVAVDPPADP